MRIFHIITHFDIGGAERVAVNIAKSQTTGMEYHLVEVVRGNGEFSQASLKNCMIAVFVSTVRILQTIKSLFYCFLYGLYICH